MFEGVRREMELVGLCDWKACPVLCEEEIRSYEVRSQITLPEEYREFLKQEGNGFSFWYWPLTVHGLPLPERGAAFRGLPDGVLVLAETTFGDVLCADPQTGRTYEWSRYQAEVQGKVELTPCGFEEWLDHYATVFNRIEWGSGPL